MIAHARGRMDSASRLGGQQAQILAQQRVCFAGSNRSGLYSTSGSVLAGVLGSPASIPQGGPFRAPSATP